MNKHPEPPKWALDFLEWFCPATLFEGVLGDLLEQFDADVEYYSLKKARLLFIWNVILFFRPGILFRNNFNYQLINTIMISSYFKVATRNILKRKLYSFINAFGLSIGIAFCILIYLYIQDEKSFDQFHVKKDRIYLINDKSYNVWEPDPEKPYHYSAYLPIPLRDALVEEVPEVELATRYNSGARHVVSFGEEHYTESLTFIDNDFFQMFSFPVLQGNPTELLSSKNNVVLTPEIAEKYFEEEDPIGKIIDIDINGVKSSYTVTGIISKAPSGSSLEYSILLSQENRSYFDYNKDKWQNFSTPTFVLLHSNSKPGQFTEKLEGLADKYFSEDEKNKKKDHSVPADIDIFSLEATALNNLHLDTRISWHKSSDPKYSYILGGLAILILLIACINYIALALTTSTSRGTEVGIRKAIGARKGQLFSQFGFESLTLALLSMLVAFMLVTLFLPSFNEFTNKGIIFTSTNLLHVFLFSLIITLFIGFLAGSYPAIFLSSFRPTQVLKGGNASKLKAGFTKPLVVIQFAMSAFLMISSVIMYKQMEFITTKDLGFNKDQILVLPTQAGWNEEANKTVERFRQEMAQEPDIIHVAGTSSSFNNGWSRYGYSIDGETKMAYVYAADPYYIPALDLELVQGRNFNLNIASDSNAIIINEALARDMGWEDPLNEHLNWKEDSLSPGAPVIGVVKDYHFQSLQRDIEPLFLTMNSNGGGFLTTILVKIGSDNIPATIDKMHDRWKKLVPDKPFEYTFLNDDVAKQYASHERWMNIMKLSTGFALLLSCLGLFGLAGINAVNKTKEIGIRKVLGAELINIFILLNRQFIWLALIAFALAAPISWYVMERWLSDFKFAIPIGWHLFLLSMAVGLLVALATVSYHTIKAAFINPADTLKCE